MSRIDDVHQLKPGTVSLRQCASEFKDVQAILSGICNKKERAGGQTADSRTYTLTGWHGRLLAISMNARASASSLHSGPVPKATEKHTRCKSLCSRAFE